MSEVIVLSYKLEFKNTPLSSIISNVNSSSRVFSIDSKGNCKVNLMQYFEETTFNNDLNYLTTALSSTKNHLKGNLLINKRSADKNTTGVVKVNSKGYVFTPTALKITCVNSEKEHKKPLTQEEKLELLKRWSTEHPGELPANNTIYEEFNLGRFYKNVNDNGALKIVVDDILGTS